MKPTFKCKLEGTTVDSRCKRQNFRHQIYIQFFCLIFTDLILYGMLAFLKNTTKTRLFIIDYDRNNSISILIWIQVHGDSIFLFEVKFLAQITFRVNAFSLSSFCSTWSCHSTAFIFPAVSFSFSVFPLNLQQLSSQSETLTWKKDDFGVEAGWQVQPLLCL